MPCGTNRKGIDTLKRLKQKILSMEANTKTYKEMYEGRMFVHPYQGEMASYEDMDNTYYRENIGYRIERTHKLAQDKPTITILIPVKHLGITETSVAGADYCLRAFLPYIDELNEPLYNRNRPDSEKGKYYCYRPGGEVLARNSVYFKVCPKKDYTVGSGDAVYLIPPEDVGEPELCLCLMLQVQLPEKKLRKTLRMLTQDLPDAVDRYIAEFKQYEYEDAIELAKLQKDIRTRLKGSEYCAFLANGSILPREGGSDLPMQGAVPFISVPEDEIEVCGVKGMGIRRGVTVITGGGYSGKSTLLEAVAAGIYDHAWGDGRELCITDATAMGIAAEDGRSVKNVNIAPFIKWIPGKDTAHFSTERASGSTSQAANIMEAVNMGSRLLLIDEDRSATNFMIRDSLMRELVKKEPITPFTERVRELYEKEGVSTILVIGGSGEYLSVADRVYLMEDYRIHGVTEEAKLLSTNNVTSSKPEKVQAAQWKQHRILSAEGFSSFVPETGTERLEVTDMGIVYLGEEAIDLRMLSGLITKAQRNAVGFLMRYLAVSANERRLNLPEKLDGLYKRMEKEGLDCIFSNFFTECERFMDLPRKEDVLAAVNRMRKVRFLGEKGVDSCNED
ncbi:MAG: ABC-ATPase domain-containing protein [Lachnospiraceae bacterium]|nr:ABC-ATPase domain-containing protein [Lachnospiraceae bacterium]